MRPPSVSLRQRAAILCLLLSLQPSESAAYAVRDISAGELYTCTVGTDGSVRCWGDNNFGALGGGQSAARPSPTLVSGLPGAAIGVAAAQGTGSHTCATLVDGRAFCWGEGSHGMLGDGTTESRSAPVAVVGLSNARTVAAGQRHSCALTAVGGIYCWGDNTRGQLGNNNWPVQSVTPSPVPGVVDAVAISTGHEHTCAILSSGTVKCWGSYQFVGLGLGQDSPAPVDVGGIPEGATRIAASPGATCVVTTTGGVKCWGRNDAGQVGDGTTSDRLTPVPVSGLSSGIRSVSTSEGHSCAVTSSGRLKCWGSNDFGQLGDGTTHASPVPVDVRSPSHGVRAVAVGRNHTCALLETGAVACWGYNYDGQLGNGTTDNSLAPVDVIGSAAIVVTIAGNGDAPTADTWNIPDGAVAVNVPLHVDGVETDAESNVYVASSGRVFKLTPDGLLWRIAGDVRGPSGVDPAFPVEGVPARDVDLTLGRDLDIGPEGDLYYTSWFSHRVRRIDRDGRHWTAAGSGDGNCGSSGDGGLATGARLCGPSASALDPLGNLYIVDRENCRIRRVRATSGIIENFAGVGGLYPCGFAGDGGLAVDAGLTPYARDITVDVLGNVYFLDLCRVRRIDTTGIINTIAGVEDCYAEPFAEDGEPLLNASLSAISLLSVDPNTLLVSSLGRIRKIDLDTNTAATIAGRRYDNGVLGNGDGGNALDAVLTHPEKLAVDARGNVYFTDVGRVRMITNACSDGQIGIHELCDDGNAIEGDGCDRSCHIETCWQCEGEPSNCERQPDDDGDGICNAQDACTNIGGAQDVLPGGSLNLGDTNDSEPYNDALKFVGSVNLSDVGTFLGVAPGAEGVEVLLKRATGDVAVNVTLSDSYNGRGTRGWRRSGSGWVYKDSTNAAVGGIVKAKLSLTNKRGIARVKMLLQGKNGTYPVSASQAPPHLLVRFGRSSRDACAETAFRTQDCVPSGGGRGIRCRR